MKYIILVIFFGILSLIETARIDDTLCERQLNYFNNGLTRRDDWAIYGMETK
jgi:hypothetical protein